MKKIETIVFLAILFFSVTSCKKYDEDRFYSTYTVKGRLVNKGNWRIIEVEDLLLNKKFTALDDRSISFDFDKSTCSVIGNGYSFDNNLTQFTQILKPALIDKMQDQNDSIILDGGSFEFTNQKNNLLIRNFISFGSYLYPQYVQSFSILNSLDIDFKIKKLEFGYMTLVYNDRIVFRFKKIASK